MTKQERIAKANAKIAEWTAERERLLAEREDGRVKGQGYYIVAEGGMTHHFDDFDEIDDYYYNLNLAAPTEVLAQYHYDQACARVRVIRACEAMGGGGATGDERTRVPTRDSRGWDVCMSRAASEISFPNDPAKASAFFRQHSADLDLIYGKEPK
ncbi:MAG TPA: hypothetical protein VGM92_01300 [Candidatus Kapabacteria bacterium]|jgi:hypothetical protein